MNSGPLDRMHHYIEANRRHWNEVVSIHAASTFYDVSSFKAGQSSLKPVEVTEVLRTYVA